MKYLVTLKPIENYFFGGEVTLGDGTSQNYFVKSNVLPRASALLGLMRYEILRQHDLLSYNPSQKSILDKVHDYIGEDGFSLEKPVGQYGIIRNISPVFLTDGSDFYTAMPLDLNHPVTFCTENRCSYISSEIIKHSPIISGFNPKEYDTFKYWCNSHSKRLENPFIFLQQIGITKNGRKADEKDAFYKQTLVRLAPALSFAFTVEIADTYTLETGTRIIPLGGNRSMFFMTIEDSKVYDMKALFNPLHRNGRLLALSDVFLNAEELQKCTFIWGENKPFRYMTNSTKKQHSWNKPIKAPVLYHLLSKGSVIYADDQTLEQLKNQSAFQNVGLNYFV